jgi:4-diphosphocytidyl-2-C-methyl-D-erythritol kinase
VGGTAIGLGRGDRVLPLADVDACDVVIVKPPFGIDTAEAYRELDAYRAAAGADHRLVPEIDLGWPAWNPPVLNDFENAITRRHPVVAEIVEALGAAGARASALCGSGSAVFGLFPKRASARAARRLQRPDWQVFATRTLSRRESERRMGL